MDIRDEIERIELALEEDEYTKSLGIRRTVLEAILKYFHESEAQNAKLREAIQKHLDKCKGIEPKLYVFFGFGELQKALKETEKP